MSAELIDRHATVNFMAQEEIAGMDQKTLLQIAYDNTRLFLLEESDEVIIEYAEEWGMDISDFIVGDAK